MEKEYIHKQEAWDEKECLKRSKYNPKNAFGDKAPYPGIIAPSGSSYPSYGQSVRYNGGRIIDGELYERETVPLPKIHEDFEFHKILSWGMTIRKKIPA